MPAQSATLQLACDLIRRASVTPDDAGCQSLMISRLEAMDFRVFRLRFGEVENFWAVRGESGPLLAFAGHTDVVPSGDTAQWQSPPFEPQVRDGFLYGRGAADMKGSLAAMVVACENFIARHPDHPGRIGFLITSDEEGPAVNGTVKVVEWLEQRQEKMAWCIVGEPSSTAQLGDVIKNGRRGSLGGELIVKGVQGHIAYPHLADNPIHRLAPALTALVNEVWDQGNRFFPATSFQISNIQGGTGATNVIPGEVRMLFNFRFSTEVTDALLRQRTCALLDAFELDYRIDWSLSGQPFITEEGDLVAATQAAIRDVTGRETQLSTSGGTSDGRFIAPTGAQVIEVGPLNDTIHKIDERVNVADLDQLAAIYQNILTRLLAS